jgi:hypothetical protein
MEQSSVTKETSLDWLMTKLQSLGITKEEHYELLRQLELEAKEMEKYNAKVEAKKYYLKGFEDAELTETQNCSHEQTMKDAETHFELVYPIKSEQ